jgi:hypothetical protein
MAEQQEDERRGRVSRLSGPEDLRPFRRAEAMTRCHLFWIPVSSFPIPSQQRLWLREFIDRLSKLLQDTLSLRGETFLQMKTVYPSLQETFIDTSHDFIPMMGLAKRPGKDLPPVPTMEDLQPIFEGKKKFDFNESIGDYCYWFVDKDGKKQRELFWGHGGMTLLFLAADPKTKAEPLPIPRFVRESPTFADLFKRVDPDRAVATALALGDSFRKKSLQLFAEDIKKNIQLKGVPFVIPLLASGDFFERPEEECKKWFELFDLYLRESPSDSGIVLAAKVDIEEPLIGLLEQMQADGYRYPLT